MSREKSISAFARRVSISDNAIRKYLDGSQPGLEALQKIAQTSGVSLTWLVNGEGEPFDGTLPSDFISIPRLSVHASAGNGAVMLAEDPVGLMAFQTDWLRKRNINPEFASVISATGDSMEPTIRDGDVLLVDRSIDTIRDQGIYVAVVGGMVVVKRVQVRADRAVILKSDNGLYGEEIFEESRIDQLQIVGRVMWFGRSI